MGGSRRWVELSAFLNAQNGQRTLSAVSQADLVALQDGAYNAELAKAADQLRTAHNRLDNPLLLPTLIVPGLNTQLASSKALSSAGAQTADIARDTFIQLGPLANDAKVDRAGSLAAVATVLKSNDTRLRSINLGPQERLIGPIASAHERASSV